MSKSETLIKAALEGVQIYRFGKGSKDNFLLQSGWAEPEHGFVWSQEKAASVSIAALPEDNVLAISLWGYVPTGTGSQEMLIFINGLFRGHFEVNERSVIPLFYHNTDNAEYLEIVFYIPSALSPHQAEASTDMRRLGIALAVIQLSSVPASSVVS